MSEKDYVLGTHDEEIERLGLQHRVWRPFVLEGWDKAGFAAGQTILDVGCGPGYASLDLASIVGAGGKVIAVDRSRRFLDALRFAAAARGVTTIEATELDLDASPLPARNVDGAWVRWVFAFVQRPKDLLHRAVGALRPGGKIVIYEYANYAGWRMAPRLPEHEEFVDAVIKSWRTSGGEPDIALEIPSWLEELGCTVQGVRPLVHVARPGEPMWIWPKAFIDVNLRRLAELGTLTQERAEAIRSAVETREREGRTRMLTPAVWEIIAVRR